MQNIGRESTKDNNLFFTCSLIDYIARMTKNRRKDVVNALNKKNISKIYELADVYHSDNIDRVSENFIKEAEIVTGTFDNVKECKYSIPSYWDIGKVYKRLIKVYNSFLSDKIDDYNSSMYYENPSYLLECYLENKVI